MEYLLNVYGHVTWTLSGESVTLHISLRYCLYWRDMWKYSGKYINCANTRSERLCFCAMHRNGTCLLYHQKHWHYSCPSKFLCLFNIFQFLSYYLLNCLSFTCFMCPNVKDVLAVLHWRDTYMQGNSVVLIVYGGVCVMWHTWNDSAVYKFLTIIATGKIGTTFCTSFPMEPLVRGNDSICVYKACAE